MELRIDNSVTNSIYKVLLKVTLTDSEKSKVARFGDMEVSVGGTFPSFTLSDGTKKVPSGFPHAQTFDGVELTNSVAETRATEYGAEMKTRIQAQLTALKAIPDTFVGETVYTLT